jgi:phage-related protein
MTCMLKFAFVNGAAEREYKALPTKIQDTFGQDLRRLQFGEPPKEKIQPLSDIGCGVVELKINGSPAYRCVYVAKYMETIVVLHSFIKTTNKVDKPAMDLAEKRLKELLSAVNKT